MKTKTKGRDWKKISAARYARQKAEGYRPLQIVLSNADHKLLKRLTKGTTRRAWMHEMIRHETRRKTGA